MNLPPIRFFGRSFVTKEDQPTKRLPLLLLLTNWASHFLRRKGKAGACWELLWCFASGLRCFHPLSFPYKYKVPPTFVSPASGWSGQTSSWAGKLSFRKDGIKDWKERKHPRCSSFENIGVFSLNLTLNFRIWSIPWLNLIWVWEGEHFALPSMRYNMRLERFS